MKRLLPLLVLAPAVFLAGCGPDVKMPFYGMWVGTFEPFDKGKVDGTVKAFVQLFAGDKFKLHVDAPHQKWDVIGTWSMEKNRITLKCRELQAEIPDELDQKTFGFTAITKESLLEAYKKPIILKVAADGKSMTAVESVIDKVDGRYEFRRTRPEKVY